MILASRVTCSSRRIYSVFRPVSTCSRTATKIHRRRLSSTAELEEATTSTPSLQTKSIVRHGPGDGIVTLNVGGKEFITLRSTLQINEKLRNHVMKAEDNQEFTKGAVFIDRDPAHFGLILQHLRNRADEISSSHHLAANSLVGKHQVLIQIPNDRGTLRDFFVEARYFQIKELENMLCSYDVYTRVAALFSKSGNPFHMASEAFNTARRALLAGGGIGMLMGTQNEDLAKDVKGVVKYCRNMLVGSKPEKNQKSPPAEPSFS